MGFWFCKSTIIPNNVENAKLAIAQAIDNSSIKELQFLFRLGSNENAYQIQTVEVDDHIVKIQGIGLSPLAYAMRLGDAKIWKFLIEELKASMDCLMMTFVAIRKTPMDIIWENGLIAVLKYLLPIYIKHTHALQLPRLTEQADSEDESVFAENGPLDPVAIRNTQWAILRAVEHGHIEWVEYIFEFFKHKREIPEEFNIHAEDERTGENACIIAARNANLALLMYLHDTCKVSVEKLTRRKETILQVIAVASKRQKKGYLQIVKYLLKVAQVDLKYEYEETLLLWKDQDICRYLEAHLFKLGILVTQDNLDQKWDHTANRPEKTPLDLKYEEKLKNLGQDFDFKEAFKEELESSSFLSSIFPRGAEESSNMGDFTPVSIFSRTPRVGFTPRMSSNAPSKRTPRIEELCTIQDFKQQTTSTTSIARVSQSAFKDKLSKIES